MVIYILLLVFYGFIQNINPVIPVIDQVQINNSPVMLELKTSRDIITPLGNCQISCIAFDLDGDDLNYTWSAEEGNITGEGYKINWTAPGDEGIYSINVRLGDNEENVEGIVNITVRNNHPPTITELLTDVEWINPLENCHIICRAEDSDDDELSYKWTSVDGSITGAGPIVVWTAPQQPGPRSIAVTVSDEYGGSVARLLNINVAENHPPVIDGFIVTGSEPKYLREYTDEYKILEGKSCQIECKVTYANEELKYTWSAERGEISGEGSIITWVPPGVKGLVNLTVVVTDMAGNEAEGNLVFKVETCSCVFG